MSLIIPKPLFEKIEDGKFALTPGAAITANPGSPQIMAVGSYLAGKLRPATGYALPVRPASGKPEPGSIALSLANPDRSLGNEGYDLSITPQSITLSALVPDGLFRGTQSIRQLFPPEIDSAFLQPVPWIVPAITVHDCPRFSWRGAMLDVARHFFPPAEVKKYIDLLAYYKVNVFHLHLTDDQGWRIMIHAWPRLAEYGGSTQTGGGKGGYYTQAEYVDLVSYARDRYMILVPEIEMPGHATAALASYADLNCDGFSPHLHTDPLGGPGSLCGDKESTYRFLDEVIGELAAITPGPYFHIGGDEARTLPPEKYNAFIARVQSILQAHGKKFIGWDETAQASLAPGAIVQHWLFNPPDCTFARKAVEQGAKIIMSPGDRTYLDIKYDPSTPLGQTWAGYNDVRHSYEWDPAAEEEGVSEDDILGVEAPLWTETIATLADIETMAFPRLPGLAEKGWSPSSVQYWTEYRSRLAAQAPRWKAMGVSYYPSPSVPWEL